MTCEERRDKRTGVGLVQDMRCRVIEDQASWLCCMWSELPFAQEMCRFLSANSVPRLWQAEQEVSVFAGVITTTQSFDREQQREYTLSVTATDQAQEPLIGVCRVTVLIADVNDNDPKFENSRYQCECYLTACPGTAASVLLEGYSLQQWSVC